MLHSRVVTLAETIFTASLHYAADLSIICSALYGYGVCLISSTRRGLRSLVMFVLDSFYLSPGFAIGGRWLGGSGLEVLC